MLLPIDYLNSCYQLTREPTHYLYKYKISGLDRLGSYSKEFAPKGAKRVEISEIAKLALDWTGFYTKEELSNLNLSLLQIKSRVDHKRCGPKKFLIIFLSSLSNYFKGFGFIDSSTLMAKALSKVQQELN